jgi:dTDP-4-amino-4,6-dideoxygalactose transaminase
MHPDEVPNPPLHDPIPELDPEIIAVTRPLLPPVEEFIPYLHRIWDNQWLTNNGPFHQELEAELADYLGVKHISLFTNGTLALVTALQALEITGEVITTPFSFVATSHALRWNNLTPVFADIDPKSFNLDPEKVEAAITPKTGAILPVHCFGHPCEMERLGKIAKDHHLKVIYDAAHAFGVGDKGGSILRHGDLSVLSFHATKVFNTFEGGAIVSHSAKMKEHIDHLKNFGYVDELTVVEVGINGKMCELQAAFGLLQLKHIGAALKRRGEIDALYRKGLQGLKGVTLPNLPADFSSNFSYFPVLINGESPVKRDEVYAFLKQRRIYARRYFYPLISEMPMYFNLPSAAPIKLPNAVRAAEQVLCLPIYPSLTDANTATIVETLRACLKR